MSPSPPDDIRKALESTSAKADGESVLATSHSHDHPSGALQDPNPYASGSPGVPVAKPVRQLSVNEKIGVVITSLLAAGASFFATCAGGAFAVSGLAEFIGPSDSGLGTLVLIAVLFVIPLIVATVAFVFVYRSRRY